MRIIETTADLEVLCAELKKQTFITVDSEFVREKTYYSNLCLIQVAWQDGAAIIDPLAVDVYLDPFVDVLQCPDVLKVFHSGRQDIEIFYNLSGLIPTPVFDTQIAAQVCGFGPAVGYDTLVKAVTGVELDKSSRLTDWSKRPLDMHQLEYALRDVTYLIPCYEYLDKYLKENNRQEWIAEDMQALCDENLYRVDPDTVWQRLRYTAHSAQFLAVLKDLAAWRERRAMKHNVPRATIMRDDILLNIAALAPQSIEEMLKVRNIRTDVAKGKLGMEVVELIRETLSHTFDKELRKIDREKRNHSQSHVNSLVEILKLLLKIKSDQYGVVARLIASETDLKNLACGVQDKSNPALQGWRYDIFGRDALCFRKGKTAITYDNKAKKIVIFECPKTAAKA
jgi:ribonuclease D